MCVRIPDHPLARDVIRMVGTPLAAPSANPSGKPSATSYAMFRSYFDDDAVPCALDG